MIYKKTHTEKTALENHIEKLKKRGLIYRVNGMTVEYGAVGKSNNTSIKSKNTVDLITEAAQKGYKKVKVIWRKLKASDFPKETQNLPRVKSQIGTQKVETLSVIDDTTVIVSLLKNKDVEKIYFV